MGCAEALTTQKDSDDKLFANFSRRIPWLGDGALRCSFEALSAIGASQPDDAKTGAKALFRVRTSFEDQFAER